MASDVLFRGRAILPTRVLDDAAVLTRQGRIAAVGRAGEVEKAAPPGAVRVDAGEGYLSPGFVDLHCHGGCGCDFMDGTPEAFRTALAAHARHGTTGICPTTTVARHDQILRVLELCRQFQAERSPDGAHVLGCHFYGPYFNYEARGAHPGGVRNPDPREYESYL